MMVATVQKCFLEGCFLINKNNRHLGLKQNNLNHELLVNLNAFALHSNAACPLSLWKNKMMMSTVHGPALASDATVKQLYS